MFALCRITSGVAGEYSALLGARLRAWRRGDDGHILFSRLLG